MSLLRRFFPIISFIVILLLSLRSILVSNQLIGHNWDFSFPYPTELFSNLDLFSRYAWIEYNLGSVPILNISHLVPNTLLSWIGGIAGSVLAVKLLLLVVLTVAFIGYKKLLDYLSGNNESHYLFSLLFAFSPFLFNEFIGGSWYMWISYAAAPYFVLSGLSLVLEKKWRSIYVFLISSIFLISSLQNLFCTEVILFMFILFSGHKSGNLKPAVFRYAILHLLLILFNSYWLVTFVLSFKTFTNTVFVKSFSNAYIGVKNSLQSLPSILNISGYLDRNMYLYTFPNQLKSIFTIAVYTAWILILYGCFFIKQKRFGHKSYFMFWLGLFVVSAFITKGGNIPFAYETMFVFQNFPIMTLFRSPQHLMFFPAFIVPILLSYTYDSFREQKKLKILVVIWCIVFFWIAGWYINGDLGRQTLTYQKRDRINFFALPKGLHQYYLENSKQENFHRVLFLPSSSSPLYIKTPFQDAGQGGIPEYLYLQNPTFTAENNRYARAFELIFCKKTHEDYFPYLQKFGVKNIVLRRDILPSFTDCLNIFNADKIEVKLDGDTRLYRSYKDRYITVYTIREDLFLPVIFSPSQKSGSKFMITSSKLSPVEHLIRLERAPSSFLLNFSSNYSPYWHLNNLAGIPGKDGYGNVWNVKKENICKKTTCTLHSDGTYSTSITLYFSLQNYFSLGLSVSVVVLIGAVAAQLAYENKHKKA